jgi:hypothetical protein
MQLPCQSKAAHCFWLVQRNPEYKEDYDEWKKAASEFVSMLKLALDRALS